MGGPTKVFASDQKREQMPHHQQMHKLDDDIQKIRFSAISGWLRFSPLASAMSAYPLRNRQLARTLERLD